MQEHKPDLKVVPIKTSPKKKIKLQRNMDLFQALSIKPILPNTIALGLGFFILCILNTPSLLPPMSKLIHKNE